ncbi:putative secreted protein [Actinomadura verrucosospora]|uniref:Putative secreted protein n=1 Tax=Actinomadura verrucosospora TaxID=46165 RepID=A0A7D4AKG2_ACTVE|nr:putative secreted protein [Actinomadura verrucosospora]
MLGLALLALTACGFGSDERNCTLIGSETGINADITGPDASRVASASLRVCWDGTCRTARLVLRPSATTVPRGCDGEAPDAVCAASASPDGGRYGFARVADLPESPVQVTLTLRDRRGRAFLDQGLRLTPKATYPNGPHCGRGGTQGALTVANGKATARAR